MSNHYMPFFTGDYMRKTRRFRTVEHGAYLLILFALWDEGGSIEYDDEEIRIIAKNPRNWTKIWAKISPYFIIKDGRISHKKVTQVLDEVSSKRRSYAARGRKGGRKKSKNHKENNTTPLAELKPSSSNQAKGLGSPLKGKTQAVLKEKPEDQEPPPSVADASAPARESGGGLSSPPLCDEAKAAIKRIRQHPGQLVSNRDKDLFKAAVRGWRDGVFLVCPDWLDRHGARFATVLSDEGCRAEPIGVKPDLKLVRTG